ncbi:hypothetical protein GCM10025868_32020 [Angustibacter aerolatus]|uniref:Cytochrome P450 n=1 Tax=Angustibacter aerolatus TaxID=1162965 RepID=A0ABQ6JJL5_9ACTN|nr:hypothetical protein GCM10025868_32020 [Angustibacter aerolatus]
MTYAATAIGHEPRLRERLAHGAPEDTEAFAHEVRRRYPFVPVLGALARKGFAWGGVDVHEGDLVLLDVHGSHHDPQVWPQPGRLDLDRFHGREPGPFEPAGAGWRRRAHRPPLPGRAADRRAAARRVGAAGSHAVPPERPARREPAPHAARGARRPDRDPRLTPRAPGRDAGSG